MYIADMLKRNWTLVLLPIVEASLFIVTDTNCAFLLSLFSSLFIIPIHIPCTPASHQRYLDCFRVVFWFWIPNSGITFRILSCSLFISVWPASTFFFFLFFSPLFLFLTFLTSPPSTSSGYFCLMWFLVRGQGEKNHVTYTFPLLNPAW